MIRYPDDRGDLRTCRDVLEEGQCSGHHSLSPLPCAEACLSVPLPRLPVQSAMGDLRGKKICWNTGLTSSYNKDGSFDGNRSGHGTWRLNGDVLTVSAEHGSGAANISKDGNTFHWTPQGRTSWSRAKPISRRSSKRPSRCTLMPAERSARSLRSSRRPFDASLTRRATPGHIQSKAVLALSAFPARNSGELGRRCGWIRGPSSPACIAV